jgi:hypothetical protein
MTENTFGNGIFAIRPVHGQAKIGVRSHSFSVTLYNDFGENLDDISMDIM